MKNIQTLKGFRDFLPAEKTKRDFVMGKIQETFELFGFQPLETPTLEYASLLLGKYGKEADKLIYCFKDRGGREVALKYDQTVPTARVLAQYQNQLPKYFRRYQIQNVFRADKPQKGRFREFTQCDIDIFGAIEETGIADAEILACTYSVFKNLGFKNISLKINNRKVLFRLLKQFSKTKEELFTFSILQSIDKLNKIGQENVIKELVAKGLSSSEAKSALINIQNAQITPELQKIISLATKLGIPDKVIEFEPQLVRGLDYYTGMIFEVVISDYTAGSCAGGGRYDTLFNQLANIDVPAVGMAIGFDRIVEAADQLNLIPEKNSLTKVLITIFEKDSNLSCFVADELRKRGIKTELYPAFESLDKQFKYADKNKIPWVIIIGPEETKENKVTLKNLAEKKQELVSIEEAINKISSTK